MLLFKLDIYKLISPTIVTVLKSLPSVICLLISNVYFNYEENIFALLTSVTLCLFINFMMFEAIIIFKNRKLNWKNIVNKIIRNAVDKLSEKFKAVIVLRDIQGLSYEDISEIINVPIGTVKSRINRARLQLQVELKHLKK